MAKSQTALDKAGPAALELYRALLATAGKVGPFTEEIKKTSIHLVRKSAFAGVQARKEHLILTLKSEKQIRSKRVFKAEQVSKSRWHSEIRLAAEGELDKELFGWLKQSYAISA